MDERGSVMYQVPNDGVVWISVFGLVLCVWGKWWQCGAVCGGDGIVW